MRKAAIKLLKQWHDVDSAYEAGKAEGRRLERRRIRRMVRTAMTEPKHEHCDTCWYLGEIILESLGATTKPAKRNGR